jgi:hypothetical protein
MASLPCRRLQAGIAWSISCTRSDLSFSSTEPGAVVGDWTVAF